MKNKCGIQQKVRMLPVTDNWYPCYEGGTVRLRLDAAVAHITTFPFERDLIAPTGTETAYGSILPLFR